MKTVPKNENSAKKCNTVPKNEIQCQKMKYNAKKKWQKWLAFLVDFLLKLFILKLTISHVTYARM
jgi:hypothetical protein